MYLNGCFYKIGGVLFLDLGVLIMRALWFRVCIDFWELRNSSEAPRWLGGYSVTRRWGSFHVQGGPRQAPKGGTLIHWAYWNLLHKILDVAA